MHCHKITISDWKKPLSYKRTELFWSITDISPICLWQNFAIATFVRVKNLGSGNYDNCQSLPVSLWGFQQRLQSNAWTSHTNWHSKPSRIDCPCQFAVEGLHVTHIKKLFLNCAAAAVAAISTLDRPDLLTSMNATQKLSFVLKWPYGTIQNTFKMNFLNFF